MYNCSSKWSVDWISLSGLEKVLHYLSESIIASPFGRDRIGINYGLHFTGGEPFLNFDLLVRCVKAASNFNIPSLFVESNCFWCVNDDITFRWFSLLRDAGLHGILVSVNPFILEYVPFDRMDRAVRIGGKVFNGNVMVYQESFYRFFREIGLKNKLSLQEFFRHGYGFLLNYAELLPMGRLPYRLGFLYKKYPAEKFFKMSCRDDLTRNWHIHIDNYFNYIPGYCGGISLGDARDMDSIFQGIDLDNYPILNALSKNIGELYRFAVDEYNYRELKDGYISKCHLCLDIRKHIVEETDEYKELKPIEYYHHIE